MNKRLSVLFFSLFLSVFLSCSQEILAENNRIEYQCQPGCNGSVLSRDCWEECIQLGRDENDNEYCEGGWETKCNSWQTSQQCQSWQKCDGQTSCYCSGQCLSTPNNVYPGNGEQNMKPPFNIVWNYTPGAGSYRYKLEGTNQGTIDEITTNTFYTPESCVLKTNSTHYWQVQACCNANGGDCGSWNGKWSFKTDIAPELLTPKLNATSTIPVKLDWCDNPEAKAYSIRIYRETGEEPFSPIPISKRDGLLPTEYNDTLNFLTKDTNYYWEVATCLSEDGSDCKQSGFQHYSQRWKFGTIGSLQATTLISPADDQGGQNPVGLPLKLDWEGIPRSMSYLYYLTPDIPGEKSVPISDVDLDYSRLKLDKIYKWKIKSCWDYKGKNCETNFSAEWSFRTTGAPPAPATPVSNATNVPVPTDFEWGWNGQKGVPGAKSYILEVSENQNFSSNVIPEDRRLIFYNKAQIDYPILKTFTDYWWRVKTCSDLEGKSCGEWSSAQKFKTFELVAPSVPLPGDKENLLISAPIGWNDTGAKFYQYKVDYISASADEKGESCLALVGQEAVPPTIIISSDSAIPSLKCLGEYQWTVRSCLDEKCNETSQWGPLWNFNLVPKENSLLGGIIPCGRGYNTPGTPYDETEKCQFKHIFLLLNNMLNLILWRIGLIVLVLLALWTGVIYYFSMGAADTLKQVKSVLKSTFRGYLIIFVSWIIINIMLALLGYQVGIFGKWWQISF